VCLRPLRLFINPINPLLMMNTQSHSLSVALVAGFELVLASSADSTIRRSAGFPAVFVSVVGEMAAASPSGAHDANTIITKLIGMAAGSRASHARLCPRQPHWPFADLATGGLAFATQVSSCSLPFSFALRSSESEMSTQTRTSQHFGRFLRSIQTCIVCSLPSSHQQRRMATRRTRHRVTRRVVKGMVVHPSELVMLDITCSHSLV
jgi:hypothetical protein